MHSRCSETSYTTYPDIKATNVYTLQNQSDVGTPHDMRTNDCLFAITAYNDLLPGGDERSIQNSEWVLPK